MLYPEAEVYEIAWDDYWQDWPAGPPSFIGPHTNKGYFREGLVPADREDILVACMTVRA
jgi:hypothetical protein